MNLPNSLTVTRIFLVPLLVVVLLTKFEGRQIFGIPNELVGAAIFGLASLTDWADGYLARRRKQITPLGQMIDPLADKLLTLAARQDQDGGAGRRHPRADSRARRAQRSVLARSNRRGGTVGRGAHFTRIR